MSSILIRRANMVAAGSGPTPGRLPAGYTELAYLESDGNQYINTGIIPNANTDVSVTLALNATTANKYILGRYMSKAQYYLYTATTSSRVFQWAWSSAYKNSSTVVNTAKHTVRLYASGGTSYLNVDGTDVDSKTTASQTGNTLPFTIFRGGESSISSGISQKIYGCVIKNSGTTAMELVPAMRDSDSVVGMYDLVSDTFLTNAGSGTFSYGTL